MRHLQQRSVAARIYRPATSRAYSQSELAFPRLASPRLASMCPSPFSVAPLPVLPTHPPTHPSTLLLARSPHVGCCILHVPEREDDGLKAYAARNCQLESQGSKKLRQIALELESACDRKLWCQVEHNRHCCTDRPAATCTMQAQCATHEMRRCRRRPGAITKAAVGHAECASVTDRSDPLKVRASDPSNVATATQL